MDNDLTLFDYIFIDNKADKTLFLLHGTGGGKEDFLFLNDKLQRNYNFVGLKGNIDENGMNRFFKRLEPGVFDQENIKEESLKLQQFIKVWMTKHKTKAEQLYFLGYSNGANMLLATLFYSPQTLKNVLLLHPMLPFQIAKKSLDLTNHEIFISVGIDDPIVSPDQQLEVINTLKSSNAQLNSKTYQSGHQISNDEISDIVLYLQNR